MTLVSTFISGLPIGRVGSRRAGLLGLEDVARGRRRHGVRDQTGVGRGDDRPHPSVPRPRRRGLPAVEVYETDRNFHAALQVRRIGYVLAVACNNAVSVPTCPGAAPRCGTGRCRAGGVRTLQRWSAQTIFRSLPGYISRSKLMSSSTTGC